MFVLSLSYWESDVWWRQNNKHLAELAPQNGGKQLINWYEEITSLSPYVCKFLIKKFSSVVLGIRVLLCSHSHSIWLVLLEDVQTVDYFLEDLFVAFSERRIDVLSSQGLNRLQRMYDLHRPGLWVAGSLNIQHLWSYHTRPSVC